VTCKPVTIILNTTQLAYLIYLVFCIAAFLRTESFFSPINKMSRPGLRSLRRYMLRDRTLEASSQQSSSQLQQISATEMEQRTTSDILSSMEIDNEPRDQAVNDAPSIPVGYSFYFIFFFRFTADSIYRTRILWQQRL
jgi:hypothetical protein